MWNESWFEHYLVRLNYECIKIIENSPESKLEYKTKFDW